MLRMKFSALALLGLLGGAAAFTPSTHIGAQRQTFFPRSTIDKSTSLQAKVGVVGATGAVGKEIGKYDRCVDCGCILV